MTEYLASEYIRTETSKAFNDQVYLPSNLARYARDWTVPTIQIDKLKFSNHWNDDRANNHTGDHIFTTDQVKKGYELLMKDKAILPYRVEVDLSREKNKTQNAVYRIINPFNTGIDMILTLARFDNDLYPCVITAYGTTKQKDNPYSSSINWERGPENIKFLDSVCIRGSYPYSFNTIDARLEALIR